VLDQCVPLVAIRIRAAESSLSSLVPERKSPQPRPRLRRVTGVSIAALLLHEAKE
jgi:hypothetical protein